MKAQATPPRARARWISCCLAWLAVLGAAARADQDERGDVARTLEQLASDSAGERLLAQRWLAVHLSDADWPVLARAARDGDLELRRRLGDALASGDRHLGLAVQAAASPEQELAALGREAIGEMLARWSPGLGRTGLGGDELARELAQLETRAALDTTRGTLGDQLDRVARMLPDPALVLDPGLDEEVRRLLPERSARVDSLEGTPAELLRGLARAHRVELEGFGFRDPGAERWLRLCKRGDEGRTSGRDLLTGWCLAVAAEADAAEAAAGARALAASGWPAALGWLERRGQAGSQSCLEGLLIAAGRGRVVPGLLRPDTQRELYALADRELAHGAPERDRRAERIARALGAAGPLGPGGEDLVALALERWSELGPRRQWLRLVVLERQGAARPEVRARAEALLARRGGGAAEASLRFQALRTLVACPLRGARPPELGGPAATWTWAAGRGLERELLDLVLALRCPLPEGWLEPGAAPADATPAGRRLLCEWALMQAVWSGAPDVAPAVDARLGELAAGASETEARAAIASWSRRGSAQLLARSLARLRAAAGPAATGRLDRLALATRAVPPERQLELLVQAGLAPLESVEAALTLAAQVGGQHDEARIELLRRSQAVPAEELGRALALAATVLREQRRRGEPAALEKAIDMRDPGPRVLQAYRRALVEWDPPQVPALERHDRTLALTGPD